MKRAIWSSILAFPFALTATGISVSVAVSDAFRYIASPGTMVAVRVVRAEPSHRSLGVFIDAVDWYARTMSFAVLLNTIFYGLFIFGFVTTVSALTENNSKR